jgi:hypothetical protein
MRTFYNPQASCRAEFVEVAAAQRIAIAAAGWLCARCEKPY